MFLFYHYRYKNMEYCKLAMAGFTGTGVVDLKLNGIIGVGAEEGC